jgi:hypothetical protein
MKPFRVKHTMTQEYLIFADSREEAIDKLIDDSYRPDFDSVEVNGEYFAQGDLIDGKTTAQSLGDNNLLIFQAEDYQEAIRVWLSGKNNKVFIRDAFRDGHLTPAGHYYNTLNNEQKAEVESIL